MIVSHKHKFIFIKNEKTAGSSVEIALSGICGPKDIITKLTEPDATYRRDLGIRGDQNLNIPLSKCSKLDYLWMLYKMRRRTYFSHISASELKKSLEPGVWESYFKFCFERNPFDKFVSWYYWAKGDKEFGSMRKFIDAGYASHVKGFELWTIDAIPVVDKIYRYEDLQKGLDDISEKLNLAKRILLLEFKAKGNVRKNKAHYREILGDYERDMLSKIFAREIKYLGYEF